MAEDYVAYLKHRSAVATTARASSTPGIVSNQLVPGGKQTMSKLKDTQEA